MYINREGIEVSEIPEGYIHIDNNTEVKTSWVVRLIKTENGPYGPRKLVVGEEPYDHEPTLGAIKYCLAKYPGTFAVKEQIFTLEDIELPFD